MTDKLRKTILGAVVAVALAAAASYGLISQQTADQLQTKVNQTLQNDQGTAQPAPQQPTPQAPAPQTQAPSGTPQQNPAPMPAR